MTRSRRLAPALVLLSLSLAACGGGGGGSGAPPTPRKDPPPATAQELQFAQDVLDRVNQERTARGLVAVTADANAASAAYQHAFDMDDRNFFSHTNPDGEDPGDRLDRNLVFWTTFGENIAQGQLTPQEVMTDWMNSPGHRENILDPSFRRLGVGVHIAGGGPWWVQDFMAP